MDDGSDGVEEGEALGARPRADRIGERRRGEGAGRDHDAVPVSGRQTGHLLPRDRDAGMRRELRGHGRGEALAVDGEGRAGRNLMPVGHRHDEGAELPHLPMDLADGVHLVVVGTE